jgi:hypothetical protein
VKIKFHSIENIEWHCMELNWIEIQQSGIQIKLQGNGMQIGSEGIENLFTT